MRFSFLIFAALLISSPIQQILAGTAQNVKATEQATNAPVVIDEGPKTTRCPSTFQLLGKECVKVKKNTIRRQAVTRYVRFLQVVREPAVPQCPAGSQLTPDGVCATYSGELCRHFSIKLR